MPAEFDLKTATVIEFGVGIDEPRGQRFVLVPIDANVQDAVREMVITTREEMKEAEEGPTTYDPSQKYGAREHLLLPLDDELAAHVIKIHTAENLRSEPTALSNPTDVFCYFARMLDGDTASNRIHGRAKKSPAAIHYRCAKAGTRNDIQT